MAVYTKKGDKGKTSLYDNEQISKDSLVIKAIGKMDELNSYLGIVVTLTEDMRLANFLKEIQRDLLTIGAILAGSSLHFYSGKTKKLERLIDDLEKSLPPLKSFVVPGGSRIASHLQYARSLARRAECAVVALNKKRKVKLPVLAFLNRLSDTLFMLAREANWKLGIEEEKWKVK
jgi:cob(I)alamin adenosyltransferase